MKIAIKDAVRRSALQIKLIRQRLLIQARFLQPATLSNSCRPVVVTAPERIALPAEFVASSSSYGRRHSPEFFGEEVYRCSFDSQVTVHEARFVRLDENRYLDVGNQGRSPWPILGKPFDVKPTVLHRNVLVPWGSGGASYGDFVIQVLPKIARLLEAVPNDERQDIGVCLPYFPGHPWAVDYLGRLGIRKDQILDGSATILVPAGGTIIVGSGPKSGHGTAHPQDMRSMIGRLAVGSPHVTRQPWRKLYVSRRAGRIMGNETAILAGLIERGFQTIHLEDFSLCEQIKLFREAAVVAGPHGAGHANIIWSSPATRLLEVFHPSWMHPCYALISKLLGISYDCLVGHEGTSRGSWTEKSRYGIFENPSIEPATFFRKIDSMIQ